MRSNGVSEENTLKIRAIAGLGNEGNEYAKTYHNAGHFVAHILSGRELAGALKFFSLTGYMNNIGAPVKRFIGKSNVAPAELLVVHDEADLPVGEYKISFGGGSAGHKGVQSVIDNLGTEAFWRLRIGVRDKNEQVRRRAEEFVLFSWGKADEEVFERVANEAFAELLGKKLL